MKKANKKAAMYSIKNAKLAKKKSAKGFTLVELIVVIAIIGILAVVLVPNMMKYVRNARLTTQNDGASKVAEQANMIAAEMEVEGITLSGIYKTAALDLSQGDGAEAAKFLAAMKTAMPTLEEDIGSGYLAISFSSTTGQVDGVVYQEAGSSYIGTYPTATTLDNYKTYSGASDKSAALTYAKGTPATTPTT